MECEEIIDECEEKSVQIAESMKHTRREGGKVVIVQRTFEIEWEGGI